jgi:hypothetical protein
MPTKLKAIVDDLTSVPEAYRQQYQKDTSSNRYYLQEIEIPDPVDVSGLTKNRDDLLREKKALEQKYAGIDPEEFKRIQAANEKNENARLEGKGEWEALKQQLQARHGEEVKRLTERTTTLTSALEGKMVDAEASAAIAAAKGIPTLLLPHVKQSVKVFEEDGRFIAKVIDPVTGTPRIGDAKGSPMTIIQLVEEMKASEVYGRAFEASYARGSGAPAGGGRGAARVVNQITREQFERLNPAERAEHFKNSGVVVDA